MCACIYMKSSIFSCNRGRRKLRFYRFTYSSLLASPQEKIYVIDQTQKYPLRIASYLLWNQLLVVILHHYLHGHCPWLVILLQLSSCGSCNITSRDWGKQNQILVSTGHSIMHRMLVTHLFSGPLINFPIVKDLLIWDPFPFVLLMMFGVRESEGKGRSVSAVLGASFLACTTVSGVLGSLRSGNCVASSILIGLFW